MTPTATTTTGRQITLQKVCAGVYAAGVLVDRTTRTVRHYGAAGGRGSYYVFLHHTDGTETALGHVRTLDAAATMIAAHVDATR